MQYAEPVLAIAETADGFAVSSPAGIFNGILNCRVNDRYGRVSAGSQGEIFPSGDFYVKIGLAVKVIKADDGSQVFFIRNPMTRGSWLKFTSPAGTGIRAESWVRRALFDYKALLSQIEVVDDAQVKRQLGEENVLFSR